MPCVNCANSEFSCSAALTVIQPNAPNLRRQFMPLPPSSNRRLIWASGGRSVRSFSALADLATAVFVRSILPIIERKFGVGDGRRRGRRRRRRRRRLSRCRQLWLRIYRSRGWADGRRRDDGGAERGSLDRSLARSLANAALPLQQHTQFSHFDQGRLSPKKTASDSLQF